MRRFYKFVALFFVASLFLTPKPSHAFDLSISLNLFSPPPVAIAPPPLPIYIVPAPPMNGYFWVPGHWLWADYGYFWVPGTWVQPPVVGVLWTPGYWGWREGYFAWHEGYWGPHVGFYGGVNYGGGYNGRGFNGGTWRGNSYTFNRSVTNVTNVTNVTKTVSFNGGPGGLNAVPTQAQETAAHEQHLQPTKEQLQHAQAASHNSALVAANKLGKPEIAATTRPGDFTHNVVASKQAGARNQLAEQHNEAVVHNPALAKNAALPKTLDSEAHPHSEAASRANKAMPRQEPTTAREVDLHPRNQPFHQDSEPAHAVMAPHGTEPREAQPAAAPIHEPDIHPKNQPFHPEVFEPRKEPAEHPPEGEGEHRQPE